MPDRVAVPTEVPTDLPVDPHEAMSVASDLLDEMTPRFMHGVGSKGKIMKESPTDIATEIDLEIERIVSDRLRESTGIDVHGEEFGGPPINEGTVWIVDPIDGTGNYSLGIPVSSMLISLVHNRQPVLGLTWMPQLDIKTTSITGEPVKENGRALEPLEEVSIRDVAITLGSLATGSRTTFPPPYRREVFEELTTQSARTRKLGSTGVDLAFVASGRFSAGLSFGSYAWDNAAGACHVRCAGGIVTDLAGEPWSTDSDGILAGAPGAHAEVVGVLKELGDPANVSAATRRRGGVSTYDDDRPWLREGR